MRLLTNGRDCAAAGGGCRSNLSSSQSPRGFKTKYCSTQGRLGPLPGGYPQYVTSNCLRISPISCFLISVGEEFRDRGLLVDFIPWGFFFFVAGKIYWRLLRRWYTARYCWLFGVSAADSSLFLVASPVPCVSPGTGEILRYLWTRLKSLKNKNLSTLAGKNFRHTKIYLLSVFACFAFVFFLCTDIETSKTRSKNGKAFSTYNRGGNKTRKINFDSIIISRVTYQNVLSTPLRINIF